MTPTATDGEEAGGGGPVVTPTATDGEEAGSRVVAGAFAALAGTDLVTTAPVASPAPSHAPGPAASPDNGLVARIGRLVASLVDTLWVLIALALDATPTEAPHPDSTVAEPTRPPARDRLPLVPPRLGTVGDVTHGTDLSVWNRRVPYRSLRAVGIRFAFVKATQGTSLVDPAYRGHVATARRVGILVGTYHFYDYRLDGRAQADHFLDTLAGTGTLRRSLPLVVDVECFAPFGAADRAFAARELRAFVGRVFERTGRLPMIYTSWYMWRQVTGGDPSFGELPLWVACWRCPRPLLPSGWDDWTFWQVGSVVVGPDGRRVGSDVFDGTARKLRLLVRDRRPT